MADLLFADESYAIRGDVFEVYRELGGGFLEAVYQECLERELTLRRIPFRAQPPLALSYKGHALVQSYIPDLICFDKIIVELKATKDLLPQHRAQALNYLKATGFRLCFLVNFAAETQVQIERIVR